MVASDLKRRVGAIALAWLAFANVARSAELPKIVVVPFAQAEGAPERAGARFSTLVVDELKTREELRLVPGPGLRSGDGAAAPAPVKSAKPPAEATAALADGKRALSELKFEEAVKWLKNGLEASLGEPGTADFPAVLDGYVSLAVAYFRQGEEKSAQGALFSLARLAPGYRLAEGKFPPVFQREYEKARKRAEKAAKGSLSVDGPPGATVFVDGRDLGMVPVLEDGLPVGTHYVKVEGPRGERFGQVVQVRGGVSKVKASFGGTPAAAQEAPAPEPKVGPVLDAGDAARLAQYVRSAGAEYALVGLVYRSGEHRLTVASALYSARRQGFGAIPQFAVDPELLTANVEAFKLADAVAHRVASFGAPEGLPLALSAGEQPAPEVDRKTASDRRVVLRPTSPPEDESTIRALSRPSMLESDGEEPSGSRDREALVKPAVKGTSAWVWIVLGVGVAAAAGGAYYGVTEASRPVTGTVTATW